MMATSNLPIYPKTLDGGDVIIQAADASNLKTLYTAPSDGARVTSIAMTSDETANTRVIQFYVNKGSADRLLGTVNLPLNAGFTGQVATIYPLRALLLGFQASGLALGLCVDAFGNPFIQLKGGEILKVKSTSTVAAGKTLTILCEALAF